ncbi:MAG: hypothetical protein WC264_01715 [Candidatus Paceibacterota bacterium]|jgi:hypothetical protein
MEKEPKLASVSEGAKKFLKQERILNILERIKIKHPEAIITSFVEDSVVVRTNDVNKKMRLDIIDNNLIIKQDDEKGIELPISDEENTLAKVQEIVDNF